MAYFRNPPWIDAMFLQGLRRADAGAEQAGLKIDIDA